MNQQLISPTKRKNRKSVHSKSARPTPKNGKANAQALVRKVETATKNTSRQSSKPKPAQAYQTKQPKSAHKLRSKSNSPNRCKEQRPKRLKSSKLKQTPECKTSGKLQRQLLRQKKMDTYLKNKADNSSYKAADVESYFQSTRSYYPLSHERQEIIDRQSFTVSQANLQDESLFKSQYEEESDTPVITQFHPKAETVSVYQQSKIISHIPEKDHFSKAEWQAFQSLKLKNEELSNYIEQLEKVEQKMSKQAKQREQAMRNEYISEKDQMMKQIGKLKEDQNKLCQLNASLLQMVNESKQNLDALTIRCSQLNNSVELGKSREMKIEQERSSALQKAALLEHQLRSHESKMNKLQQQKQFWQQKISSCNRQKQKIKTNAYEMLKMLQKLQHSQDM